MSSSPGSQSFSKELAAAHINQLAERYGFSLRDGKWAYDPNTETIYCRPVKTIKSYLSLLHEAGHCAAGLAGRQRRDRGDVFDDEWRAWAWARSHSLFPIPKHVNRDIIKCLTAYLEA